jgi:hypothetical protein
MADGQQNNCLIEAFQVLIFQSPVVYKKFLLEQHTMAHHIVYI